MLVTKEEQLLYLGKIFTSWPFTEKKWTFSTEVLGAVSSDPEHHVIKWIEWRRARNAYLKKRIDSVDNMQRETVRHRNLLLINLRNVVTEWERGDNIFDAMQAAKCAVSYVESKQTHSLSDEYVSDVNTQRETLE